MWVYIIENGELWHISPAGDRQLVGTGYAGRGVGLNNPFRVDEKGVGPLPPGFYTLGAPYHSLKTGPLTFPLIPDPMTEMYGRDEFRIHGDNKFHNKSASEGCVVEDLTARLKLSHSVMAGDTRLHVLLTKSEMR